jgi:hypothetical protein
MLNKITILYILLLFSYSINGQERNRTFTVYSNGFIQRDNFPSGYHSEPYSFEFVGLYPSFSLGTEHDRFSNQLDFQPLFIHITDWMDTVYGGPINGAKIRHIESSISLINKYSILSTNWLKLNLLVENNFYFLYKYKEPYTGYIIYDSSNKRIGWVFAAGFEIEKSINDVFSVSLMPSYRINDFYYNIDYSGNPQIPANLQTSTNWENTFNPTRLIIRFGLKINLKKKDDKKSGI